MQQRIGSCSICGGDVIGHVGPWWAVVPPPPPRCSQCGAGTASGVIKMVPTPVITRQFTTLGAVVQI